MRNVLIGITIGWMTCIVAFSPLIFFNVGYQDGATTPPTFVRPFNPCRPFEYTSHISYCPKCNNWIGSIYGFTESWMQHEGPDGWQDGLKVKCDKCGFSWVEKTKDAKHKDPKREACGRDSCHCPRCPCKIDGNVLCACGGGKDGFRCCYDGSCECEREKIEP